METNEESNIGHEEIQTSYILREYFKGFKITNPIELSKMKEKVNKLDRSIILDLLLKQDESVYQLVAENYATTIDLVNLIF
jgi:hypothetical protein